MKTRITLVMIIGIISGCGTTQPDDAKPEEQLEPFTLYVCNQCPSISPIDIRIDIDGVNVVREDFEVGRQLNWKKFNHRDRKSVV